MQQDEASTDLVAAQLTVIDKPGPNDVLLGRGAPIIKYIGNVKYRAVIKQHKERYNATRRRLDKDAIAKEVMNIISSRNGRFLQRVRGERESARAHQQEGLENFLWKEASLDVVIEKIKQALRDREPVKGEPGDHHRAVPPRPPHLPHLPDPQQSATVAALRQRLLGPQHLLQARVASYSDQMPSPIPQQQHSNLASFPTASLLPFSGAPGILSPWHYQSNTSSPFLDPLLPTYNSTDLMSLLLRQRLQEMQFHQLVQSSIRLHPDPANTQDNPRDGAESSKDNDS